MSSRILARLVKLAPLLLQFPTDATKRFGFRPTVGWEEIPTSGGGGSSDRLTKIFNGEVGTTWEEVNGQWWAFHADSTNLFPTVVNTSTIPYPRDPTFPPYIGDSNGSFLYNQSPVLSNGSGAGITLFNNFELIALVTGSTASGAVDLAFRSKRALIAGTAITEMGFNIEFAGGSQPTSGQIFSYSLSINCGDLYFALQARYQSQIPTFRLYLVWSIPTAGDWAEGEIDLGWAVSGGETQRMVADLKVTFTATAATIVVSFSNSNTGANVTRTHTVNAVRNDSVPKAVAVAAGINKSVGTTQGLLGLRRARGYVKTT